MSEWRPAEADYNLRQLRLAGSALAEYLASDRRVGDLGALVGTLDGLNAALEAPDGEWQDQLENELVRLESTYAVHLDRGVKELEPESAQRIEAAVGTLQGSVASASEMLEQLSGGGASP
jgi:hypothetical protein